MPIILVTNDDGIDSPTLVPLVRALQPLGEVRTVVPSSERSWIGKAITRFDTVYVEETQRDGVPMFAVNGTPADCVSLGVHGLAAGKPDFVVSGINLGLNFGLAFILSSGTVGGAFEGWIAGIPSIALSMAIPNDAYGLTGARRISALGDRPVSAAAVGADIVATIVKNGFPAAVDLFSVNMPADVDPATPRVVARVTRSRYGRLFVPGPDGGYLHRFSSLEALESLEDGDMEILQRGAVAINPLRLDLSGSLPATLQAALENRQT
ncbi:MAG: 5'/3'-nucleotidase SurE [Deltaproteobacteria bacterium]|nr:5'/3'-nucleotidase SurE [Deltaproteobacteria bacterium]